MRRKLGAMRRSVRLPCFQSTEAERQACAASRRGGMVRTMGGGLESASREQSVPKRTRAPSASNGYDDAAPPFLGAGRGALKKEARGRCPGLGPIRIAAMFHPQPWETHQSLYLACGTGCRSGRIRTSTKAAPSVHIMCKAQDYCANREENRAVTQRLAKPGRPS